MTDTEGEIYTRLRKRAAVVAMLANELQCTERSILAALIHLQKQGRVRLRDDGYWELAPSPKVTFYAEG